MRWTSITLRNETYIYTCIYTYILEYTLSVGWIQIYNIYIEKGTQRVLARKKKKQSQLKWGKIRALTGII